VINDGENLLGIIRYMLDDGSIPAIIKVDANNIGLCLMIQNFTDILDIFCPEITLLADLVKNTKWEEANKDIALIVIPTLALLPYGMDIKSTVLDNDFIKEMQQLPIKNGFWAKMMVNAHEQYASDFDTSSVISDHYKRDFCKTRPLSSSNKGFQGCNTYDLRPDCRYLLPRKKSTSASKITSRIFSQNPTLACVEIDKYKDISLIHQICCK
jgi:hypothetical protein